MRGVHYSACSLSYKKIAQFHQKCSLMRDCSLFRRLLLPEYTVLHHLKGVLKGSLAFLQHFKFVNWRMGESVVLFFWSHEQKLVRVRFVGYFCTLIWDDVTIIWDENLLWFFSVSYEIYFEANLRLRKGCVISFKKTP